MSKIVYSPDKPNDCRYIVANGDFELIKVGRYKRATKESFEKWYQNQTRYRLVAEDGQERR